MSERLLEGSDTAAGADIEPEEHRFEQLHP